MANTKISNLTALGAAPATDDLLVVVDTSAGETKKLTVANLIAAVAGIAPQSGRQLTVKPANGSTIGFLVDTVASPTEDAMRLDKNGAAMIRFDLDSQPTIKLQPYDNGAGLGSMLELRENNNASTPAAGVLRSYTKSVASYFLWVDDSGSYRIGTTAPTNANDTSGTVVGMQTSWHELKENIEEWNGAEALEAIRALTLYSYQMIEDSQETRGGEKPTYKGLVIQDADRESDAWFALGLGDQQVPVLNDRNLFGYMLAAIRHGGDIIVALQERVAALEAQVGQ